MWHWLLHTPAGLMTRIGAGVLIFATLAILDYRKHRQRATRWREYRFLLLCVFAGLVYGFANDQITCTISPEFFLYGKGIVEKVRPDDSFAFRWEVTKVGLQATWTAGLIIGVAMLIANNPSASLPSISDQSMMRLIAIPFISAAIVGTLFGILGALGVFTHLTQDFEEMVRQNEFRPRRFMAVFGIHLGGYVGGVIGTILAIIRIRKARPFFQNLRNPSNPPKDSL